MGIVQQRSRWASACGPGICNGKKKQDTRLGIEGAVAGWQGVFLPKYLSTRHLATWRYISARPHGRSLLVVAATYNRLELLDIKSISDTNCLESLLKRNVHTYGVLRTRKARLAECTVRTSNHTGLDGG